MKITIISALCIFIIIFIIRILLKCKKPFSKTLYGILFGIITLISVHIIGRFIGVEVPISVVSIGVSSVAGVPGVILILLINSLI